MGNNIIDVIIHGIAEHFEKPQVQSMLKTRILRPVVCVALSEVQVYLYGLIGFLVVLFILMAILIVLLMAMFIRSR